MAKIDSLAGNSERPELVPPTFQILPDGRSARAKGESSWPNSFVHLLNRFATGSGCEFAWKTQVPDHGNSAGPIFASGNFARISAPRLPQAVQTKSGSTSDSLT